MAIGIGIGDCALILESLVRCASLLRGEAVDGFAGHAEAYRSFANATAYLRRYLKAEGHTIKPVLRFELKSLKKLLKLFISRIQKLEPSLGSNRQRRGFRRIWQKIRWPFHDAILNGICHKLNSKFSMIKFIIDLETAQTIRIVNPCPPAGLSSAPAVGPKFVLMDARSKLHGVSMAGVKSWTVGGISKSTSQLFQPTIL
ncbi:nadp:d-xylose dehydrogenase [Colletotrichum truncatum]|uniref:Nadp:d-xylose dehydrogenase n=1 Tax=Colletotrichum truncatum TaxID=5467 RepID=A0ACC3YR48_COLTU